MRITAITLDRVRLPLDPPFRAAWDPVPRTYADATVVRVATDEGLVGTGSGDTMDGFEAYADLFVGTDPLQLPRQVRRLESVSFHGGRYWPLEAALWDLAGQAYGVPVARLLGGELDRVPAYASTGEAKEPAARLDSAHAVRDAGFRAIKVRVDPATPASGVEAVRRVVDGTDLDVMVDLNRAWRMAGDVDPGPDQKSVLAVIRELDEIGVQWVEEPLPYADVAGLADLRRTTRTRVAGGEMLERFDDALGLLEADALDVYQPDCVLALGISRCRTVAELAQAHGRLFTPHTWTNGIGLLANLHLAAGVGAAPYLEVPYDPPGWTPERRDFLLTEPLDLDADGCLAVPDAPGLGVRLDEDAVARRQR